MFGKIKYQMKKIASKKNGYVVIIGIISLFLVIGGFSFAIFTSNIERKGSLNIITGDLTAVIESESLDSDHSLIIKSGESIEIIVTLRNENGRDAKFNFYYEAKDGVNVSYDSTKDVPPKEEGEVIENEKKKTYRLKIVNDTDKEQIIIFGSKVGLYNKKLTFPEGKRVIEEETDNITVVKDSNMISVVYNENSGSWEKVGINNWYNYDIGKWANAVTVTSATRSKYQSASEGTSIPMSDIETMWVYIPRYSYTIGSEDGTNYYGKKGAYLSTVPTKELPGGIDVKFVSKSVKDRGSAQYKVAEGVSGWRTPDGFTFGDEELYGIWVGKFETSSSNPSATYGGGNVTTLDPMIKPNVTSWRTIDASNLAALARNMTSNGNRYGFSTTKLNSHAMKNSEWALAAYLSQSKYGKLGNKDYSGANKEIYMNRSNGYITGCSYGAPSPSKSNTNYGCHYTYEKNLSGTGASTTGTIYGIYDMSGGAIDITMGDLVLNGQRYSGTNTTYHSGYTGLLATGSMYTGKSWLEDKYYDFYTSSDPLTACNGNPCTTHAYDTMEWYNDITQLTTANLSWTARSGYYVDNTIAGIFYANMTGGYGADIRTFRLVLSAS